ncbi:MAG TPA: L-seryl-tRNA(Sec) selenium transferase [Syntrophomonadaceae bacterium]|nr:L-seryl-tRNA(Sec) selenium transferase [Syntrophomonadaceae bacterium]
MSNLKNIPPIDEVLNNITTQELIGEYNRDYVVNLVRTITQELRQELREQKSSLERAELMEIIVERLGAKAVESNRGTLRRIINGTGVVLHTNLGRAPLGAKALAYTVDMARQYNNLEMDLGKGERGSRYGHVEELLKELTGAEAALVVNNNAAAVLLALTSMASGREVIVSRGQLVEIGGAFRIPEVMKLSGARLVEVGTTNRTYLSDYAAEINPETALLFGAHSSNYKIVGFVKEVALSELVTLGQEQNIPVMQDLGSGSLCDLSPWGLGEEPTVQACVDTGADIICFSGDKLLGGPQAGILVGKRKWIEAMKKNQLLRALRVDKLTIAALEGTLLEYLAGKPCENLPVLNMITQTPEVLKERARLLARGIRTAMNKNQKVKTVKVEAVLDMIGGGSYPIHKMPGVGVELEFSGISVENMARNLRLGNPAVMVRRQEDRMIISVRTLFDEDIVSIPEQMQIAIEQGI